MAYAILAGLEPQFGLYSSFMGVLIYWFFATSKDITIGPVAVMSVLVGQITEEARVTHPDIPPHVIASALAVVAGCIILFIGLIRMGWIVDLIPLVSISAFMTGSAINIAAGQVPALLGINGFSTRDATYRVIINTLKGLPRIQVDAVMGLSAIVLLYSIRSGCIYAGKRLPKHQKTLFFISTLRTAFVILLYTMISWLVNRNRREDPLFAILKTVPRGFQNAAVPVINKEIISIFTSDLPATVIVLLIEHIAISKSFGRINNYVIDPSQEMVAIGVSNILGPFLGGYPATGSFSRTAIKSKAGVRTPFAGVITALIVLLAIYALTAVFFYIPYASLSAVIIHAVLDLITRPNTIYQFWRVSPLEVPIFFAGVIVTVFTDIEDGIYTTIIASFCLLMFRIVKVNGRFLGKVKIHSHTGETIIGEQQPLLSAPFYSGGTFEDAPSRNLFLPINHEDGSNPEIEVQTPQPGIIIYRFSEGFNYPNANHYLDQLTSHIFRTTRRTNLNSYPRPGDRPWNDPGPVRGKQVDLHLDRPTLKAIILDFSSVNNVDITSVQQLIDVRNQLDKYVAPSVVDWHFASINNRWTKRALVAAGFGYPTVNGTSGTRWKPIFSVAEIGGDESAAEAAEREDLEQEKEIEYRSRLSPPPRTQTHNPNKVPEHNRHSASPAGSSRSPSSNSYGVTTEEELKGRSDRNGIALSGRRTAVVTGLNRPLFHVDLTSALQSAVTNVREREEVEVREREAEDGRRSAEEA